MPLIIESSIQKIDTSNGILKFIHIIAIAAGVKMETIFLFSTCSAVADKLDQQAPVGITLRRLKTNLEFESVDFSQIHFVAYIDLDKISIMTAINYILPECSEANSNHYFELNGRRFSFYDRTAIHAEAEKLV